MLSPELLQTMERSITSSRLLKPDQPESNGGLRFTDVRTVSGGCINQVYCADLTTEKTLEISKVLIKINADVGNDFFAAEADGLSRLANSRAVRTPKILARGNLEPNSNPQANPIEFLILEFVDSVRSTGDSGGSFAERFGRQLALMHQQSSASSFGLNEHNFIGTTRQENARSNDWAKFWCEHRMQFQFELARNQNLVDRQFTRLADSFVNKIQKWIAVHDPQPVLIHGDLWSGNFFEDSFGNPVIFDPAVYYADREAEFGMTTLFGGLDSRFYSAYNEVWNLPDGAEDRIEIYRLYHLLNHLNLFGTSYLPACLSIMRKYA